MHTRLLTLLAALALTGGATASAQYYEIANQIPNLITPALQGGFNYKGFIEAEYLHGVGDNSCDFFGISTVQGFRYSSWFFMGAGLGVQYVHTSPAEDWQPTYYPAMPSTAAAAAAAWCRCSPTSASISAARKVSPSSPM